MIKKQTIQQRIANQHRWIDEHGGNLYGYVQRYGSADDPKHYGNGGEAIYAADFAALQELSARAR